MPDQDKFDRGVVYFGLLISVTFPVISGIVPVLGYLTEFLVCFYLILFAVRRMWTFALIGSVGSLALMLGLFGFHAFLVAAWAKTVIPPLLFGAMMSEGIRVRHALTAAVIAAAITSLAVFLSEKELIYSAFDQAQKWVQSGAADIPENGKKLDVIMAQIITFFKRTMPSLLAMSAVMQLFIGWLGAMVYMNAVGLFMQPMLSFYYWKMPDYYIYGLGLFFLARLGGPDIIKVIADNLILFLGLFYAVFGFALFEYYLKKLRLSLFLRILFYIGIILLQIPGLVFAALVGVFDSYFDFRKVRAKIIG